MSAPVDVLAVRLHEAEEAMQSAEHRMHYAKSSQERERAERDALYHYGIACEARASLAAVGGAK